MTPFYFGTERQRLFGVYEPAALTGKARGKHAAVICPPWGNEHIFAHRAMRRLSVRLSGAGIHTLRFDFLGTGDSAGEMVDADLAGWEADIALAMDELRDIVGLARITLIGLRLGATLAARVAASRPKDVDSLVLWDPILSGPHYLASLGVANAPAASAAPSEICGIPLSARMRRDFLALDLTPPFAPAGVRALILVTDRSADGMAAAKLLGGKGERSDAIEFMTAVRPWIEDADNEGAVPVGVIQRIAGWLE